MEEEILVLKNLSKHFGNNVVLKNINLTVNKGDIYGVLGLSGAGKSTLVRCINGLEKFDSGEILYNGVPVVFDRFYKRQVAMIFQGFNLLQQRTVLKNVELAGQLIGMSEYKKRERKLISNEKKLEYKKKKLLNKVKQLASKKKKSNEKRILSLEKKIQLVKNKKILIQNEIKLYSNKNGSSSKISKRAIELLKRVGLEEKLNCYPSQLSGGQQQRVAIARALMTNPNVLLCDEATSALDPDTTQSILELLKELNKELNLTIIIISHQMSVIEAVCNKVAIIDKAEIVENGKLYDVFLSPKTDIAKKLVYSGHVNTKLDEHKLIKIIFNGEVDTPIIANIIQDCSILVSIVYADSKTIDGKIYGQIIIKLPYYEKDILKLKTYLELKQYQFEEVLDNEIIRKN